MKKINLNKKLQLNKETIANLNAIKGGSVDMLTASCADTVCCQISERKTACCTEVPFCQHTVVYTCAC